MEPTILQSRRWGGIAGFLLMAPVAGLLIWSLAVHFLPLGQFGRAAVVAILGIVAALSTVDFGIRAVRPNRLLLMSDGFTLETAFRSRTWSWEQYAGLHGWYNRVLLTGQPTGGKRRLAIGHWQPDLDRVIGAYASQAGRDVGPDSDREMPSPLPYFILSGSIVAAVAVALALS